MKQLKIGFVLDDSLDKTDGVQQYVVTLGRWFSQQGHEVHYLVGQSRRRDLGHVHSLSRNLQVHFNQNRMSMPLPANKKRIQQLLDEQQFDVLHVQMPYSPWLAGRIIKMAPPTTAIVATFHIIPYSSLERLATRLLALYLWRNRRKIDDILSVSPAAAAFARQTFRASERVLPNTVALTHFHSAKPYKHYDDGMINIVFVGRLVPRKGALALVEALAQLHTKNHLQNVRVLICGKGPLLGQLKRFIRDHHLGHVVHVLGFIGEEEKPRYLASADIAIFPSLGGESFGIVLIEAMAAARGVVIGGDNIGYQSVLGQHPDQLIDPSDTPAFAKKLLHFIRNRRARQAAHRWQQTAVRRYDVRVIGSQLEAIYNKTIAKKRLNDHNESHE